MTAKGGTPKRHWTGRCEFPLTEAMERGHVATFGRKCRTKDCTGDMSKAQTHELWCAKCKREERLDDLQEAAVRLARAAKANQDKQVREMVEGKL